MEFIGAIHSLANCTNVPQTAKSLRPPHTIHPIAELLLHRLHRSGEREMMILWRDKRLGWWTVIRPAITTLIATRHHHHRAFPSCLHTRESMNIMVRLLWIIRFYLAFCSYSVVCGQWRWLNETFCTSPRDWGLIPKSCPAKVRSLLYSRFN